jgi:ubiquinone/menaquinone biosynthesis C-methylase UbiE
MDSGNLCQNAESEKGNDVSDFVGSVVRARSPLEGSAKGPSIPQYLSKVYWWAYVHPRAVKVFEREWLVNLILFGNYGRLRDKALDSLTDPMSRQIKGRILQVACVYGDLTPRLTRRLSEDAKLDVVDILPVQLRNLKAKLPCSDQVRLIQCDSASLPQPDDSYDQTLLFFLLHEQPEDVRRATLCEALRVTRPGGKLVIVDYHQPVKRHPLRPLMKLVFRRLEPYAIDLWENEVLAYLPGYQDQVEVSKKTFFGGLYQMIELQKT